MSRFFCSQKIVPGYNEVNRCVDMAHYFIADNRLILAVARDNGAQVLEREGYVECTQEEYERLLAVLQAEEGTFVRDIHGD